MAIDLSKLNIFAKMGTRARIATVIGGIVGVIFLMYIAVQYFSDDTVTTGASRIRGGPGTIASVPGGRLTPEYARALQEANVQGAEQAEQSGGSAVPTLLKTNPSAPEFAQQGTSGDCNIICSEDLVNVKATLDDWVRKGQISPEVSSQLQQLADQKLSVDEYAAELDRLVREGKLTPEQARRLLDQYKKQHANDQLKESAAVMDDMIKSGALSLDAANNLLAAQKDKALPAGYAAMLDRMAREGRLSPDAAKMLLAQYTQQRAKDIIARSVASLKEMGRNGQLTPEVLNTLIGLENQMVPVSTYQDTLNRFINEGKLIPLIADKIIAEYKDQKAAIGPTGTVNKMLQQAEAEAYGEINDLLKEGRMSQDVAARLTDLIQKDIPLDDYIKVINQYEKEKKIPPDIAKLKIADYRAVKGFRRLAPLLSTMQGNDVPLADYAAALQDGVNKSELSPQQAEQLMQEYEALRSAATAAVSTPTAGDSDFARLQQRLESQQPAEPAADTEFTPPPDNTAALQAAQLARERELQAQLNAERAAAVEAMSAAMAGQAEQLVTAWQPPVMQQQKGVEPTPEEEAAAAAANGQSGGLFGGGVAGATAASKPPIVKAGTILFAVLDTTVNSDYPDSPVLATIVAGKYKGAKLMGKMQLTEGVAGQQDRLSLNFTLMNMDVWDKSLSVTAFAIDPDTARTVLASHVDYHYLKRFGAIMATSFLQGYASAITNAGTSTTGIFGTSTTHPELSPTEKIATALGQMGQTLGAVTEKYTQIPPTVKVNAGVGLGILFMSDVSSSIETPAVQSVAGGSSAPGATPAVKTATRSAQVAPARAQVPASAAVSAGGGGANAVAGAVSQLKATG